MSRILFVSLLFCLLSSWLNAQSGFTVKDVLVSDPGSSIIDPEYNVQLNMVCWQSDDEELWVCSLDPLTGHFVPANGKGFLVDLDLTPPTYGGWNGPEWMLSHGCTQIVYNQKKGGTRYPGLATQVLGGWSSTTLMQYPGALYSMATRDYTDSTGLFLFESNTYDGIRWVRNTDLNTCHFYPNISLGFFADDNQQICCALNHSRQPGFLEVTTTLPFFTQISHDTIGAPFMWNDPETNSRMFMYRTNGNKTLKVFQENWDGNWYLYHSFTSPLPDPYVYITSPEPFTFKGKSYVSFMAAESPMGLTQMPAQIWIASVNPYEALMRRVSDSAVGIRVDPEPVVFNDSAFIYYTEKIYTYKGTYIHRVRKCNTGLENLYTPVTGTVTSTPGLIISPNPSSGKININWISFPGSEMATIQIINLAGRVISSHHTDQNPFQADLTDNPKGVYLVRIQHGQNTAFSRLILQ